MLCVVITNNCCFASQGQQIRVYHAIVNEAHAQGFVVNSPPTRQIKAYKGGYVQTPTPQLVAPFILDGVRYFSTQNTLDFASLYPSAMQQFGLCYTKFIPGEEYETLVDAYDIVECVEKAREEMKKANRYQRELTTAIERARMPQIKKWRRELSEKTDEIRQWLSHAMDVCKRRMAEHWFYEKLEAMLRGLDTLQEIEEIEVPKELHLACFRNEDGGVYPTLITRYKAERNKQKKLKKKYEKTAKVAEESKEKAYWLSQFQQADSGQLAVKVMVNSSYGFTGANPETGKLPLIAIAATTTCMGRWAIRSAERLSQVEHSVKVNEELTVHFTLDFEKLKAWTPKPGEEMVYTDMIYGDSVTGDTAMVVRVDGIPVVKRMDELVGGSGDWYDYHGDKEAADVPGLEVLDENGWTRVNRMIRHKTDKKMFRVVTHTGVVDCTEDHGLLDGNMDKISPTDVNVGDELLHIDNNIWSTMQTYDSCDYSVEEVEVMGLFAADGSCGAYDTKWGVKYSWAINNSNHELLERASRLLPFETKILETLDSSGVYKLVPVKSIKPIVEMYRHLFYNESKNKRIPSEILFGPLPIAQAFFDGFYSGDGDRKEQERQTCWRFDQKSKTMATCLFVLSSRLGWNVSINTRIDKTDMFRITLTKHKQRKPRATIKKIDPLPQTTNFVYDLETASHHFHVGPGNLVVHNTDSIMPRTTWKQPSVLDDRSVFEQVMEVETDRINVILREESAAMGYDRPFLVLEFEKHGPMAVKGPKMYAMHLHEPTKDPKMCIMGLRSKRRDSAPVLVDVFEGLLKKRLADGDADGSVAVVDKWLDDIVHNRIPVERYKISTSIGRNYDNPRLLQPTLQRKIREKGGVCDPGDRVHYVVTKSAKKQKKSEMKVATKAEPADYTKLEAVDRLWYLKEHVQKAVLEMYEIFKEIPTNEIEKKFDCAYAKILAQQNKQNLLSNYFATLPSTKKTSVKKAEKRKRLKMGSLTGMGFVKRSK